jgi:hypothetical protein
VVGAIIQLELSIRVHERGGNARELAVALVALAAAASRANKTSDSVNYLKRALDQLHSDDALAIDCKVVALMWGRR